MDKFSINWSSWKASNGSLCYWNTTSIFSTKTVKGTHELYESTTTKTVKQFRIKWIWQWKPESITIKWSRGHPDKMSFKHFLPRAVVQAPPYAAPTPEIVYNNPCKKSLMEIHTTPEWSQMKQTSKKMCVMNWNGHKLITGLHTNSYSSKTLAPNILQVMLGLKEILNTLYYNREKDGILSLQIVRAMEIWFE